MNLPGLLKKVTDAIRDPEREFSERIFLILTIVSEVSVFIAFIADIITRENPREIMLIAAILVLVPVIVLVSLHYNRLYVAIRIIVLGLVFLIVPGLFFFGGGLEGGGVLWIIFSFMFVGLVLHGGWRRVMLLLVAVLALVCYLLAYFCPEIVYHHTRESFYIDSFVSLVMVGILCYVMTLFQGLLFSEENLRAKKEKERAEELTMAQNRFFSSMSHEIRTPINSILGLNELILRDEFASDDIVRDANGIQGAGKMLLSLINDILDFSKIEAGSMEIVNVDYRVGDMLSEIVNMMWLRAHDKGLGFEVSVDPKVPTVLYGDEVRIKQVILNLLNNAVKYTKKGKVELRVESKQADNDSVELWITVSDTGMGIRKEDIPYLFNAFKRVDEGKNRHIEGTGLGLSIVKQLVEMMDGTVSVSSVYGEGSTFTVMIRQPVSDGSFIGELNIHNQQIVKRSEYESSFLAPEARILIVDDNEMNLEVESRLLADTDMGIDKARSGKEALEMCMRFHYDAVFMDHLMPEMDGIECLQLMRGQDGGLNRNTPVIVLTANAGSWNREIYNKAGFDGYLVKPVSGEAMEDMLIRHISSGKIILRNVLMSDSEDINASDRFAERAPVIITTSSMCDLPEAIIRELQIPVIPFAIHTRKGVFRDGVHMDAYELIRYVSEGGEAYSSPPDEEAYTEFFAESLKRAHHLIHIAITESMSEEFRIAQEAAKSFDNVSVVNSGCLTSATGILVLMAYKMVQQGLAVNDIVSELEEVKHRLRCSFIINNTDYMVKKGLISARSHRVARALNLHPALKLKDDRTRLGGVWIGRLKRAYRKYIRSVLSTDIMPDREVLFVTYVDISEDMLDWIGEEIRKIVHFERIIFQQASAAISSNCGPGSFGLLYCLKSNKSYNIASYFDSITADQEASAPGRAKEAATETDEELTEDVAGSDDEFTDEEFMDEISGPDEELTDDVYGSFDEPGETEAKDSESPADAPEQENWYAPLDFLDIRTGIRNSGSEDAFRAVLKMFHASIPERYSELESCFSSEDWPNYTIRVHALKSSARLVGALDLGEDAHKLEMAGKDGDADYIRQNHAAVMQRYLELGEKLAPVFDSDESDEAPEPEGEEVDEAFMADVYDRLRKAALAMDCDMVDGIVQEMEGYVIPESDREKLKQIRRKADIFEYDGVLELLG